MKKGQASYPGLWVLLVLFLISVVVRLPHINRPLSTNYEWVTAHTLVTLQILHEEGIFSHRFSPIYTFPNPNDHYIKCPISGISDSEGNYYYVSYPPFSFIFPHIIFETLRIYPDVLSLQILNLGLHLISGFLIYLILLNILTGDIRTRWLPAVAGASIYVFAPLNLWHHANVYFADILVQPLFLLDIYLIVRLFTGPYDKKRSLILGKSLFLTMYTEWLGFLLGFMLFVYAWSQIKKNPKVAKSTMILCIVAGFAALILTGIQYGSITGFSELIETLQNRYTERSGQFGRGHFYDLTSYHYLLLLYLRNYFPIFVIIALLLILKLIFKSSLAPYPVRLLFLISAIPALLHHFILFEFTLVHDLALVKSSVFMSLLIGILFHAFSKAEVDASLGILRYMPHAVTVCMLALSVFLYHAHVIEPENFSLKKLGLDIKTHSTEEDTIYFKTTRTLGDFLIQAPTNFVIAPQIQYYSGRCIQVVPIY